MELEKSEKGPDTVFVNEKLNEKCIRPLFRPGCHRCGEWSDGCTGKGVSYYGLVAISARTGLSLDLLGH